jgi:DNA polymerase III sliding clamp (beta) subunit (PCNA family)
LAADKGTSTRCNLQGVHFALTLAGFDLAATDSKRLSYAQVEANTNGDADEVAETIPIEVIQLIRKSIKLNEPIECSIQLGSRHAIFTVGEMEIVTPYMGGRFPNVANVMSMISGRESDFVPDDILPALRLASAITNDQSNGVTVVISDAGVSFNTQAEADHAEVVGKSLFDLDAQFTVDSGYLTELLTECKGSTVEIVFKNAESPIAFCLDDGRQHILMTMAAT